MSDFSSHYRFILPGAETFFDFRDKDAEAIQAINHIRENDLPVFVADWSNDAYDVVFINVPQFRIRYFNPDPITEHLPESEIFGDLEHNQNQVFAMFGFSLNYAPAPTVVDDWSGYTEWMQGLFREVL